MQLTLNRAPLAAVVAAAGVLAAGCGSSAAHHTAAPETSTSAPSSIPPPSQQYLQTNCMMGNTSIDGLDGSPFVPADQVVWAVAGVESQPIISGTISELANGQYGSAALAAGPFLTKAGAEVARAQLNNGGSPTDWISYASAAAQVTVKNNNAYEVNAATIIVNFKDSYGNSLNGDYVTLKDSAGGQVTSIAPGQTVAGVASAPSGAASCSAGQWQS